MLFIPNHRRPRRPVALAAMGIMLLAVSFAVACSSDATAPSDPQPPGPPPVASVAVAPATVTLTPGDTVRLTATPNDSAGHPLTGRTIAWSSSDTSIATVSSSGLVTARTEGSATITATSESQHGQASVTVNPTPVASVAVAPDSVTLIPGDTVRLVAMPKDSAGNALSDRPVTWSSSDTSVATVDSTGLVTARAVGSTTITATAEDQHATAHLTVDTTPVARVALRPASDTLLVGDTLRLAATALDAAGDTLRNRPIGWTSSDSAIAVVDATGFVTARAEGAATITATSEGQQATATLTVQPVPVSRVVLSADSATLVVGDTLHVTATTLAATGDTLTNRPITWSSSDTTIATVTATGLVTARAAGTAMVTATAEGHADTLAVRVQQPSVATVTVRPDSAALFVGDTLRFAATVLDARGDTLTDRAIAWTSSDTTVATVGTSGLVTARTQGTVTITATVEGHAGKATLTVTVAPVAQVVVSTPSAMVILGNQIRFTATVLDTRGDTLTDRPITWSSSDTTIATVDSTGVVTPHLADTVTITATADGQSGTTSLRVVLRFAQLDAGSSQPSASLHTCGMTTTGAVYCWGRNAFGALGDGTMTSRSVPVASPGAPTFAQFVVGNDYTCALDQNGHAYCWGNNAYGQLGDGTLTAHAAPKAVAGNLSFTKLFAGDSYVCGLIPGGAAYCWGRNTRGQLGDGTTTNESTPTAVHGNPTLGTFAYTELALGGETTCGLTGTGAAYCWGDGMDGQLGLGIAAVYVFPVPVAGNHTFAHLSASGQHVCGVTTSGAAYCWGDNQSGQLGGGTTADSATSPVAVAGGLTFTRVIAAQGLTCGLTSTGAAYCWGNNSSGQLGNGAVGGSSRVPVAVAGGLTFSTLGAFSADSLHAQVCGLTTSGAAYCWGDNRYGQLGNGTTTTSGSPVAASSGVTFTQLRVGYERACGLTSAHIAYCWGNNGYGQLGDGTTIDRHAPTLVAKQW